MKKLTGILGLLFILGPLNFACSAKKIAMGPPAEKYDRACLVALMDQYLAAVVKHDPAGVPIVDDVKLVQNLNRIPVGKGLWETATGGPTEFKIYVADPVAGQIGFMGVIQDQNKPALLGARLKLENDEIHEIEAIGYMAEHGIKNGWE